MIYTLKVRCVAGPYLEDECLRVIEVEKDTSLYSLHEAIQAAVDFGRDHLFDFYTANSASSYTQKQHLSEHEEWEDRNKEFSNLRLEGIWPLGRRKLYYLFDFGDQWLFEIRKARGEKEVTKGTQYPRVIQSIGPNPTQYPSYDD